MNKKAPGPFVPGAFVNFMKDLRIKFTDRMKRSVKLII